MNKLKMVIAAALITIGFASCLVEVPRGGGYRHHHDSGGHRHYGGHGYYR